MRKGLEIGTEEIGCADAKSGEEEDEPDEESGEHERSEFGLCAEVVLEVGDG